MPTEHAREVMRLWANEGLFAFLFTGGEPTVHPDLLNLVKYAKELGIERVGLATNGSADMDLYERLWKAGVDDFSLSLDADNAEDAVALSGRSPEIWRKVVENIRQIAKLTRTTIGLVIDEHNVARAGAVVRFALSLGVDDIRVNPAAQYSTHLPIMAIDPELSSRYPNLSWRLRNRVQGLGVRGLRAGDASRCWLAYDEMTVSGEYHYPCFVYMREGGKPIGRIGPDVREQRERWLLQHQPASDPICVHNCADCCIEFNRRFEDLHPEVRA